VINEDGLKLRLANGMTLPVPARLIERYAPYRDREMILGLRPEHLTEISDIEKPGVARLELLVDVIEPMGMETMVHSFIDGVPVCARIDPSVHAAPTELLPLAADMNRMHLIDEATGRVV
jgi:multiple sugar transport system ATP-binding protein